MYIYIKYIHVLHGWYVEVIDGLIFSCFALDIRYQVPGSLILSSLVFLIFSVYWRISHVAWGGDTVVPWSHGGIRVNELQSSDSTFCTRCFWHQLFDIWYLIFDIWYLIFDVLYFSELPLRTFDIYAVPVLDNLWCLIFWYLVPGASCLTFVCFFQMFRNTYSIRANGLS